MLKRGLERGLGAYGYQIVNPASRYGIDVVADVKRLAKLWRIDVETIFDVGANVGRMSLTFRAAWPAARIVAFEPNASVARELAANVEAVGGISVEEVALCDRSGRSKFYLYGDASNLSSLAAATPYTDRHGLQGNATDVAVTTFDAFCRERSIERVNLLKIDTEGSDYDVLVGAGEALAAKRIDFVTCEFYSLDDSGQVGSLLPIARLLSGYGYHFIFSYNDYIVVEGAFFSVSNALFAADRPL